MNADDATQETFEQIPGNSHAAEQLRELLGTGLAIAFVGAGASAGLYPLWTQLIAQLADEAVQRGLVQEPQRKLWVEQYASKRPQQAVQGIKNALQEGTYRDVLGKTFGPREGADGRKFTPVHEALLRLPFRGYVTTNYDAGLLEARRSVRPGSSSTGSGTWKDPGIVNSWLTGDIFHDEDCPILFAHGSYDRPETIVLGAGAYRQAYRGGLYRELMKKLWTQERLVFVGFGFSDPWLHVLADEVITLVEARESAEPRHIAVMGLDEEEEFTAELRRAEQDQYNALVVGYRIRATEDGGQDHGQLLQVLSSVVPATGPPGVKKHDAPSTPEPAEPTVPRPYIGWMRRQCDDIDLLGLQLKEGRAVRLSNVYVPLASVHGETHGRLSEESSRLDPERSERPQLMLELLGRESLYVSGAPGSGKSTFCRWVAWVCCEGRLPGRVVEEPDEYREQFPASSPISGRQTPTSRFPPASIASEKRGVIAHSGWARCLGQPSGWTSPCSFLASP